MNKPDYSALDGLLAGLAIFGVFPVVALGLMAAGCCTCNLGEQKAAIIYTVEHKGAIYEADQLRYGDRSAIVRFRDRATGKEMSIEGDYIVKQK